MRLFLYTLLVFFCSVALATAKDFPEGTVVVWENGNFLSVIQRQTGSNKTHAGIILYDRNQAYVYEASKPDVHRYTIEEYIAGIKEMHKKLPKLGIYFLEPAKPYTAVQIAAMKKYAHGQLGRKFGVQSYMVGRPLKTIHCCEYIGNTLAQTGRFKTLGPRETPKTIFEKAKKL